MGGPGREAAEEIYRRYADRVFRFIYRRVGERAEDAEDLTLETFLAAIKLAKTFEGRSSAFAWLCGIARVRMIDHHRRNTAAKRHSPYGEAELTELVETLSSAAGSGDSLEEVLSRVHAEQVIDAALSLLNEQEREALLLRYVEGLTLREIAQHMSRSEHAVESLLARAKSKPRNVLQKLVSDEGGA
jgi:RNA polymerase sigma-70 factor (ECF subfamily)